MPSERIDPGSPVYLLIVYFFLFFAGAMIVLLGRSTIKRRRLSNSRKLYLITGVSEYQGTTAVVLGRIIEVIGYVWLAGTCLLLLGLGVSTLLGRSRQEDAVASTPNDPSKATIVRKRADGPNAPHPMEEYARKQREQIRKNQEESARRQQEMMDRQVRRMEELRRGSSGGSSGLSLPGGENSGGTYSSPPAEPIRTWTSADGKFSIQARFVEEIGADVRLQKEDGSMVKIEKSKLSSADQEWLKTRPQ
jgi:hypothetical protein